MMHPASHRLGFLQVEQYYSVSPKELLGEDYDVTIVVPSWDARTLALADGALRTARAVLPIMVNRGQTGARDVNEERLLDYLAANTTVAQFAAESEDVSNTFDRTVEAVGEVVKSLGRPLKVLIELSTTPRYLSFGLMAWLLRLGWASSVSFFYSAGLYVDPPQAEPFTDIFTLGRWRTVAVPGLEGCHDPGKRRQYVVNIGFEGSKTYRLLAHADPDSVAVLFPDPGVREDYVARTQTENSEVFSHFPVSEREIVRAGAADVVGSLIRLEEAGLEESDAANIFYLTAGTKPQGLALAIRAFYLDFPALLYPVPQRHREASTTALPHHWLYRVIDRSAVTVT